MEETRAQKPRVPHYGPVRTVNAVEAQVKFFRRILNSVSSVEELTEPQKLALQRLLGKSEPVTDKHEFYTMFGHDDGATTASTRPLAMYGAAASAAGEGRNGKRYKRHVEETSTNTTTATYTTDIPIRNIGNKKNRHKKVKKLLKEIDELEQVAVREPSRLTPAQKDKIARKDELCKELEQLNIAAHGEGH